jgi:hypothetical protein
MKLWQKRITSLSLLPSGSKSEPPWKGMQCMARSASESLATHHFAISAVGAVNMVVAILGTRRLMRYNKTDE